MESFFKASNSTDLIKVQELLARKYDINYILGLNFEEGSLFIKKAFEKEIESTLWDRWLIDYKNMTKDTFVSFTDYKNKMLGTEIDNSSKDELLELAEKIKSKSKNKKR